MPNKEIHPQGNDFSLRTVVLKRFALRADAMVSVGFEMQNALRLTDVPDFDLEGLSVLVCQFEFSYCHFIFSFSGC